MNDLAYRLAFAEFTYLDRYAAQWDESKHPRAEDGKFGEGGGAEPSAPEPTDHRQSIEERLRQSHKLKTFPGQESKAFLSRDNVKAYRQQMASVLDRFSRKAIERISNSCPNGFEAYEDSAEISVASGLPENAGVMGFFDRSKGYIATIATEGQAGSYAHEFAHAIDWNGKRYEFSQTNEWEDAWRAEIINQTVLDAMEAGFNSGNFDNWWHDLVPWEVPLSAYACTRSEEGFAEFGRLLFEDPEAAKTQFPQCYAYWHKHGLVDAVEQYAQRFRRAESVYRYARQFRYAWDESKHPRAADGKFGDGPGESAAPKRKAAKGQQSLFDESTGTSRVAVGEKLADAIDSSTDELVDTVSRRDWFDYKLDPKYAFHLVDISPGLVKKLAPLGITGDMLHAAFNTGENLNTIQQRIVNAAADARGINFINQPRERAELSLETQRILGEYFEKEMNEALGEYAPNYGRKPEQYKTGMRKSMRGFSAKAKERIAKGTAGGMKAYANRESLQAEFEKRTGRPAGFTVGGFYAAGDNTIHNVAGSGNEGIYAHEFAHALDCGGTGQFELSKNQEWVEAFLEEIQTSAVRTIANNSGGRSDWWKQVKDSDVPLSAYAVQSTWEGFAEFGRAIFEAAGGEPWSHKKPDGFWGVTKGLEGLKKAFPKCYAFWEKQGLIDAVEQYRRHLTEQFKAYYARIQ